MEWTMLLRFEISDDLTYWSAEIPGKVLAKAEALAGPMTPPGKRVQTINPSGSEVGPGAAGAVATWGKAIADEVDAMGSNGREKVGQASIFHLNVVVHKFSSMFSFDIFCTDII